MNRRRASATAIMINSGCWLSVLRATVADLGVRPPPSSATDSADGVRQAVEAYVRALTSLSVSGLISVGGVKDEQWSRQEAGQILSDLRGRSFAIKDVQTQQDMGPSVASVRLWAENKSGGRLSETFTAVKEKKAWHLVVFMNQPADQGKESASTDKAAA
ncbi:hypothetical protein [Streptomyces griseus]|uniref:hypothetical protein n=1 Tax=Streptomyces griseus TaxID=1911 RepID=UPI0036A3937F